MEKAVCGQPAPVLRKGKKKQVKDELDRQKQAEKKKRRLEKALATSAAIRSELEKKKQKKMEEQQRLDEEGAAIAEAVALHVLLGEDAEESCQIMLNKSKRLSPWDHPGNLSLFMANQSLTKYSVGSMGWTTDAYGSDSSWNTWDAARSLMPEMYVRNLQTPCCKETAQGLDISPELIAAQAVSSLQIAEDSHEEAFCGQRAPAIFINRMFGDCGGGNKVNLYKEY